MTQHKFELNKHGDSLERDKYEEINKLIPNYKFFWSSYIGHDLNGNICPSNLSINSENKRIYIGQLYYSIMKKFIELDKLKTKLLESKTIKTSDEFLECSQNLTSFISLFGNIFDKEMKILTDVLGSEKAKKKQEKTQDYYSGIRNFEQHSSDVPLIFVGELVAIPKTKFLMDNDRQSWFDKIAIDDAMFLDDFVNELFNKIQNQVNSNMDVVKNEFSVKHKDFQFSYPDFSKQIINQFSLSGITETYNYETGLSQQNRKERLNKKQ